MGSRISAIRRQFNRSAAGSYDIHAHVQRKMAVQLAISIKGWKSIGDLGEPNILEIGCGTGTLTDILANEWSSGSITALDIAPAMIVAAEQRVRSGTTNQLSCRNSQPARIRFLHADVEMWSADAPTASFDLIVSNACFQWLSDPRQTLRHLRRVLRDGGHLAFTTFGPDTFHELHKAFHTVYRANGMEPQRHGLSFQPTGKWEEWLREAGFLGVQYERSIQTETYASARDFLLSVKAMGASTSQATAMRGFSPRRLFADMYKEYEEKFSMQGGVAATYDLLLIQASAT